VILNLKSNHKLDTSYSAFISADTLKAINVAKSSSATGSDGLTSIHLKCLGHYGLAYLTALFNLSVSKADLPVIWKAAVIVPVLKPGKPADSGCSYHLISLLSPAVKVLEGLLFPLVTAALPKSSTQHGFAPAHSCITALLPIATRVVIGFNDAKSARHSAVYAVPLSKAFDSINHILLIEQIAASSLHSNLIWWLSVYIRGCTARCIYCLAVSPLMVLRSGVSMGLALSWLFLISLSPTALQSVTSLRPMQMTFLHWNPFRTLPL
jgi:hypothetical protein